jgi:NTP pyrophosphatase (non-canonical NTP hydrolase)
MHLDDLKTIQAAFDRSRGFADLPFSQAAQGASRPDVIGRMQFALLGLIGEVGEASNLLKKVIRSRVTPEGQELNPEEFAQELADIFSYLLKLTDAGDVDLAATYLEKMALNAHRFRAADASASTVVTLCGPPGSGKSTIATALATKGHPSYVERHKDNPFLGNLQASRPSYNADASQRWFLSEVGSFVRETDVEGAVIDQDPSSTVS